MGNWDFVFRYDESAASWLAGQGYTAPEVAGPSRLPTAAEVMRAWAEFDTDQELLVDDFDWDSPEFVPDQAFKLRGNRVVALRLLVRLSEVCGQFWLYPDTGEPAIVVSPTLDVVKADRLHVESRDHDDGWRYFYDSLYSA